MSGKEKKNVIYVKVVRGGSYFYLLANTFQNALYMHLSLSLSVFIFIHKWYTLKTQKTTQKIAQVKLKEQVFDTYQFIEN